MKNDELWSVNPLRTTFQKIVNEAHNKHMNVRKKKTSLKNAKQHVLHNQESAEQWDSLRRAPLCTRDRPATTLPPTNSTRDRPATTLPPTNSTRDRPATTLRHQTLRDILSRIVGENQLKQRLPRDLDILSRSVDRKLRD
jgi:hypothetical protein